MNFASFFKNLFKSAIANPKTTVAGLSGIAAMAFPKYAPIIAAASSAAVGALAQDATKPGAPAAPAPTPAAPSAQ